MKLVVILAKYERCIVLRWRLVCLVFMKLELEEKGKVAEGYRIDNYKLLQRLEAVIKRKGILSILCEQCFGSA